MRLSVPNKPNHYAMWMWLANHPEAEKIDWSGWRTIRKYGIIDIAAQAFLNECFLCDEFRNNGQCLGCPLSNEVGRHNNCVDENNFGSLYKQWKQNVNNHTCRAEIAKQIAEC